MLGPGGRIRSTLLTVTLVLTLTLALALTLTQAGESLVSRPPHKMASDQTSGKGKVDYVLVRPPKVRVRVRVT